MGLRIPKPIKTAIVSREDEAGLTRRRIKKLIGGRTEYSRLEDRMLVKTRHHQADFKVTRDDHMDALIEQLGRFGAELVVLDVFRSIHDGEENDNTEVAKVLAKVSRIQTELKCACALVHHIAKVDDSNIFKGLRGASAVFFQIVESPDHGATISLQAVDRPKPTSKTRGSTAAIVSLPTRERKDWA